MNKNKIFIIIISILVLSSIGITFYLLKKSQDIPNTTEGVITTTEEDLFPTSNKITIDDTQNEGEEISVTTDNNMVPESASIEIKKVSDKAVAGITFVYKDGKNFLRYIEKGTGNIKEIAFDETIPTSITNTTITSVFDSFWGNNGETLIFRRLDGPNNVIQTIFGVVNNTPETMDESGAEIKKLDTTLLPQNTLAVAVSPNKNKVAYLVKDGENTIGFVSDFNKTSPSNPKTQIWKSPIKEWSISWPSENKISLLTKPSSNVSGYSYSLEASRDGKFEKLIGDVSGLTTLISHTGDKLIYSETTGTGFLTYLLDEKEEGINIFPVKTLPEKCVFSKINENILYCGVPNILTNSKYPDSWYQGLMSFSDNIYKIDLDVNFAGIMIDKEKIGEGEIDFTNPILSNDENYLGFINKRDNTPWMVKIR